MASLLPQLDENARLLMYLAGELPAEDAAEMERLLTVDGGLRGRLDELRQLQDGLGVVMSDDHGSAAVDEASLHRVMRAVRQRTLELAARPLVPEAAPRIGRRRTAVQYALVAMAASVALCIGLWGLGVLDRLPKSAVPDVAVNTGYDGVDPTLVVRDDASKRLDEAAEHIRALRSSDDDDRLLLML
ncbi:MAG: hypothetical protein ABSH20_23640 [Tepidisphaeraceae bacterium]|jgi:anti-sigma factor RsiW